MPRQLDTSALVKAVGTVIRDYLANAVRPLSDRIGAIEQKFDELPAPQDGRNAYEIAVSLGYEGTVYEWLESMRGPEGKALAIQDIQPMMDAALATWALDFERRATDLIQRCIDRIEKPKDGQDGMGFDDMEIVHDGERAFTFALVRGERRKEFTFKVPVVLERGIYKQGPSYEKGDGVTFGGNYWIAQRDTSDKPGENDSWRLAVRRGRDGKDSQKV